MTNAFGAKIKELRLRRKVTLRDFCQQNGFDAGNYSRLERGLFPPPARAELIERYVVALGLQRGSDEWLEIFDLAAVARGEIPHDLLTDEQVAHKLPIIFRTLRGSPLSPAKMDELAEKIRRT